MPQSPTRIAIAVVEQNDRFLIGCRPEGAALAGLWEFPGGKIEAHESAEEAARRECLEETGITVNVGPAYPSHVQQYHHGQVELHFFACSPDPLDQQPRPPFIWVSRDELADYEFPVGNRKLLELLIAN